MLITRLPAHSISKLFESCCVGVYIKILQLEVNQLVICALSVCYITVGTFTQCGLSLLAVALRSLCVCSGLVCKY